MIDEPRNQDRTSVSDGPAGSRAVTQPCSILVLGAGELGMSVIRHLVQRATSTSELTLSVLLRPEKKGVESLRKKEQLAALRSLGVRVVSGDLAEDSESDLANLFRGFDTVIGCTGFVAGRSIQLKLARAALAAGVRRYLPWQFGVDYDVIGKGSAQDLFDEQLEVRALLRAQQATEWIIVSTGMFTSFLFEPSFGVVDFRQDTVHALGSWENSVTLTTAEDIGMLTAEILSAEPRISNKVLYTAGDTVTYRQLADILDLVLERSVERVLWTVPMLKEQLAREPNSALCKYRVVFAEGRGVAWPMTATFNAERAIAAVGIERWIREHLAPYVKLHHTLKNKK